MTGTADSAEVAERHDARRMPRPLAACRRSTRHRRDLADGFAPELIAGLVLAELATVVTDTARIGGQTIKVELVLITDAGHRAIER